MNTVLPLPSDVKFAGDEESLPGFKSFSRFVPASVPSVTHSSAPEVPSFAEKRTRVLAMGGLRALVFAARPSRRASREAAT